VQSSALLMPKATKKPEPVGTLPHGLCCRNLAPRVVPCASGTVPMLSHQGDIMFTTEQRPGVRASPFPKTIPNDWGPSSSTRPRHPASTTCECAQWWKSQWAPMLCETKSSHLSCDPQIESSKCTVWRDRLDMAAHQVHTVKRLLASISIAQCSKLLPLDMRMQLVGCKEFGLHMGSSSCSRWGVTADTFWRAFSPQPLLHMVLGAALLQSHRR
jgi:hypothetical protein